MGDRTAISYVDASWNVFRGCTRVSPGCQHCYAEAMAARFCRPGLPWHGTINRETSRWSGVITEAPEKTWTQPSRWRRPRRIFVNSMSDTFHPEVTTEQLDRLFEIVETCPRHTFLVLTKRPRRMRGYVVDRALRTAKRIPANVWLGVTVEDQPRADERIPILQGTTTLPLKWLSIEPQLERIYLRGKLDGISWVVIGGESGAEARPFDPVWARDIVEVCKAAGVAVWMKQYGSNPCQMHSTGRVGFMIHQTDKHGRDPEEWPADLRVQEFPEVTP